MFQNCLTMLHTTVPTIWMDTALWVSCSAYLSGIGIKYLIFPFLLAIVCGRKINWCSIIQCKIKETPLSMNEASWYMYTSYSSVQNPCCYPWYLILSTSVSFFRLLLKSTAIFHPDWCPNSHTLDLGKLKILMVMLLLLRILLRFQHVLIKVRHK